MWPGPGLLATGPFALAAATVSSLQHPGRPCTPATRMMRFPAAAPAGRPRNPKGAGTAADARHP